MQDDRENDKNVENIKIEIVIKLFWRGGKSMQGATNNSYVP